MSGRLVGTVSMGIRAPIVKEGDNIVKVVTDSVIKACIAHGFELNDKDIIAVTESLVARSQGNYATVEDIANDLKKRYGENATIAVIWPILSRNRFAICLKGIAMAAKKVVLMLSLPADEMGNHLVTDKKYERALLKIASLKKTYLTEAEYRDIFGYGVHEFTGVDYVEYYKQIIVDAGAEAEIIFSNDCTIIYKEPKISSVKGVICCDIHTRTETENKLRRYFYDTYNLCPGHYLHCLDEILYYHNGHEQKYGLLGSNKVSETTIKLFPYDCQEVVSSIQGEILRLTGKKVEVMIYGDGAFKDPVGKIWELADPVVSPGFTDGLSGRPNEVKIKYLADNDFEGLSGKELEEAIQKRIAEKGDNLVGKMESQGTTPRQITDLVGSLCDLTSGSGDKGTPIVLLKGYFDNYSDN